MPLVSLERTPKDFVILGIIRLKISCQGSSGIHMPEQASRRTSVFLQRIEAHHRQIDACGALVCSRGRSQRLHWAEGWAETKQA